MKTTKKLLYIAVSLLITSTISAGLASGVVIIYNSAPFWNVFWFFNTLQIAGHMLWDKFYETRNIIEAVKEYASKPYKKYLLSLNCAHCGIANEIEIDLTDTEFRCTNCKKHNGIHVNFTTAAITEPYINPEL